MKYTSQIKQIYVYIKPFKNRLIKSTVLSVFLILLASPMPYFTKMLIDEAYPSKDFDLIILILVGIISMKLFKGFNSLVNGLFSQTTSLNLSIDASRNFLRKILDHDFSFFSKFLAGDILSRFGDLGQSTQGIISFVNTIIRNFLSLLIYPALLFFINSKLAFISLCLIPIDMLVMYFSSKILKKLQKKSYEIGAKKSSYQFETLNQIDSIKALNKEDFFYKRIDKTNAESITLTNKMNVYNMGFGAVNHVISDISYTLMLVFAWTMIFDGEMTLGSYVAFTSYLGMATAPIMSILGLIEQWQMLTVSFDRFFEVYNHPKLNVGGSIKIDELNKIELKNSTLSFGNVNVFNNLSFQFKQGNSYLLTGPSGTGKSSLLKSLSGLMSFEHIQNIFCNDYPLKELSNEALRKRVCYLSSSPFLFSTSISENLFFEKPFDEELFRFALDQCILNDEYNNGQITPNITLDEFGGVFSSGQKQRLALTRIFIEEYDLIILDEATSALDAKTEYLLMKNIIKHYKSSIVIVVSHRLHIEDLFDYNLELNQGKLAVKEGLSYAY